MNRLNISEEPITITVATVLGYAAGQTFPSELVVITPGAAIASVTLPPIRTSQATTLPGAVTEGCGAVRISFYLTASYATTLVAASGDTLVTTPSLGTAADHCTLRADPATQKWYAL